MGPEVVNKNKNCVFNGPYAGRDLYIAMYQDSEREFVVTHNANIKPVAYFTGRETELRELRQRIEEGRKSVLVSGMGGIGKTHICRKLFEEYLNKHAEGGDGPFHHIGYIEYAGDMGSSLMNCLKFKQQDSPEQNHEAAWKELEYLASGGKLLLFVDNVDKPISADLGLQRLKGIPGAVVLTSRQISFGDEFEPYRIGFLSLQQCIEIYERIRFRDSGKKIKPEEVLDLEYIIESLTGRHTITVELLAHLARTKLWTVKKLRGELEEKGFQLAFYKDGELVNIQKSYEILYDLSELTEAEQNILEAFSLFPYIPMEAETCNEWLLADAGVSEDDDILMGLYQKGWLQFDVEQQSYALHPVFAQFIYAKSKPEVEKHSRLIEACQGCLVIPENGFVLECQKFIPFAENIIKKIDWGKSMEQIVFVSLLAGLLTYVAKYEKAEILFKWYLQTCKKVLGENNLFTAVGYDHLAGVYEWQGKYEKAKELYEKGLEIKAKVLDKENTYIISGFGNLARIYAKCGEYDKAEILYKKSLWEKEILLERADLTIANIYNDLAGVYMEQGKYEKAKELFEFSLLFDKKILGENHPETACNYNNLAGVCRCQKKYEEAEGLQKKSLQIWKSALGENHPQIATGYNNLAYLYYKLGEYEKAEILYEKSLTIRESVFGEKHSDVAESYNNLACLYEVQGEYERARVLYKKSLEIRKMVLGEEHHIVAESYNNLAYLYEDGGEYGMALDNYLKAYKISMIKLGYKHPHTKIYYKNMEMAYTKWNPKGNFEQWLEEQMKEANVG